MLLAFLTSANCTGRSSNSAKPHENRIKNALHTAIVDTRKQHYSYLEMIGDLDELQKRFPQCVSYEMRSKTYQGRNIPVLYLGNRNAGKYVLVQSAIHAREYMSTLLVMAMLEHYARLYDTGSYQNTPIRNIFSKVCFVILPMVNPDGVEIAQKGEKGAVTEDVKRWVREHKKAGMSHTQIKSNACGVDLNRNFANGFGKDRRRKPNKSYSHYPGKHPYSEIESQLLKTIAEEHHFTCFLNYHTHGNLVYYGCKNAKTAVNEKATRMAQLIKRHTSYPLYGSQTSPECGSWGDEVELKYGSPSATIELGTRNPVPIAEFNDLFGKNKWVWADLAIAIVDHKL